MLDARDCRLVTSNPCGQVGLRPAKATAERPTSRPEAQIVHGAQYPDITNHCLIRRSTEAQLRWKSPVGPRARMRSRHFSTSRTSAASRPLTSAASPTSSRPGTGGMGPASGSGRRPGTRRSRTSGSAARPASRSTATSGASVASTSTGAARLIEGAEGLREYIRITAEQVRRYQPDRPPRETAERYGRIGHAGRDPGDARPDDQLGPLRSLPIESSPGTTDPNVRPRRARGTPRRPREGRRTSRPASRRRWRTR